MRRPGTVGLADPPRTPQAPQTDEDSLRGAGFDDAAVRRLCVLREVFPWVEWTSDNQQFDRLRFCKWRFRNGDEA